MTTAKTQNARILAHLKRYGKITQIQASAMFIMRLAARVFDLRKMGVNIICRMVKSRFGTARVAEYALIARAGGGV